MNEEQKYFYTNGTEVSCSAYDVSIKFLRNVALSSGTESSAVTQTTTGVADSLIVSMSPSHLKAMVPALIELVARYEMDFGAIPLPPEMRNRWKTRLNEEKK